MSDDVAETSQAVQTQVLASPQRQSPLAFVFGAIKIVRNFQGLNIAVVGAFVFARQFSPLLIVGLLCGLVAVLAWSAASWWKFVFCVDGDRLVVKSGVFADERLDIPLERIQSISIEEPALHRLVGLVRVGVETAGSSSVEFEIDAVSARIAVALQQVAKESGARLGSGSSSSPVGVDGASIVSGEPIEEIVVKRQFSGLVKAGFPRPSLAGLVGVSSLLPFMDRIAPRVESLNLDSSRSAGLGLVVFVAVVLVFVSVVQEIIRNWGLTISRSSTGLLRTAGLLSRTSKSTTIERVQAVRTTANVVERRLKIQRIVLPTIGSGDLHVTGATDAELVKVRELVLGTTAVTSADRPVSPWLIYHELRSVSVLLLGLGVAGFVTRSPVVLFGLLVILWVSVRAVLNWKFLKWGFDESRVVVSRTLLTRRWVEQRLVTCQTVTVTQGWLERRRGLATLVLTSAENSVVIPMIDADEASRIRDIVVATLAIDRSPWM